MRRITKEREEAALAAHSHAMRKGMTWRHAVRDAIEASDAAEFRVAWTCPKCGAWYQPPED